MGTLILQDGSVIKGKSYGAIGGYMGEIVFNTSINLFCSSIVSPRTLICSCFDLGFLNELIGLSEIIPFHFASFKVAFSN